MLQSDNDNSDGDDDNGEEAGYSMYRAADDSEQSEKIL